MECLPCEDNLNHVQPEVDLLQVEGSGRPLFFQQLGRTCAVAAALELARTDLAFYQPEMPLESRFWLAAEAVHMAWMHAAKPTESNFDLSSTQGLQHRSTSLRLFARRRCKLLQLRDPKLWPGVLPVPHNLCLTLRDATVSGVSLSRQCLRVVRQG